MRGLQSGLELDRSVMDCDRGHGRWPRRRGLNLLSASREPGQVVALCLSHSPPAFPAPTHSEALSSHRLPAQAPLFLCQPQGLTSQAGMHTTICSEGCGATGWGKGRAGGGAL